MKSGRTERWTDRLLDWVQTIWHQTYIFTETFYSKRSWQKSEVVFFSWQMGEKGVFLASCKVTPFPFTQWARWQWRHHLHRHSHLNTSVFYLRCWEKTAPDCTRQIIKTFESGVFRFSRKEWDSCVLKCPLKVQSCQSGSWVKLYSRWLTSKQWLITRHFTEACVCVSGLYTAFVCEGWIIGECISACQPIIPFGYCLRKTLMEL